VYSSGMVAAALTESSRGGRNGSAVWHIWYALDCSAYGAACGDHRCGYRRFTAPHRLTLTSKAMKKEAVWHGAEESPRNIERKVGELCEAQPGRR